MPGLPSLAIIIPVYNAAQFIEETLNILAQVLQNNPEIEIILIDDGSSDDTLKLMQPYADIFHIIALEKNMGKGFAVKSGMLASKAQIRLFTDADLPYGLKSINRFYYEIDFRKYDIAVGTRNQYSCNYEESLTIIRKLSTRIFRFLSTHFLLTAVDDTQCGIKAFNGEIADILFDKISVSGFAFDVELLYLSYKLNLDVKRIPVVFYGNALTTISILKTTLNMIKDILLLPINYYVTHKYGSTHELEKLSDNLCRKKRALENFAAYEHYPIDKTGIDCHKSRHQETSVQHPA
ncbi:MAG: glycosyltransferase [Calditrichaeota bacterium]|nr:MAG: glycosyltransferase [Calditrichota bacterium]